MGIKVELTNSEVMLGATVGVMRTVQNIQNGNKPAYGCSREDAWTPSIEGALAEMAVAKWLGRYWSGSVGDWGAGDVGDVEVRSTTLENGRLLMHKEDKAGSRFILVRGIAPTFELAGWAMGHEHCEKRWWADPTRSGRPAYFIPDYVLRRMEDWDHE